MKRLFVFFISVMFICAVFTACGSKNWELPDSYEITDDVAYDLGNAGMASHSGVSRAAILAQKEVAGSSPVYVVMGIKNGSIFTTDGRDCYSVCIYYPVSEHGYQIGGGFPVDRIQLYISDDYGFTAPVIDGTVDHTLTPEAQALWDSSDSELLAGRTPVAVLGVKEDGMIILCHHEDFIYEAYEIYNDGTVNLLTSIDAADSFAIYEEIES